MSAPYTLYITLHYLRTDPNGQNKYHWGIYATSDKPPRGSLFHATDLRRAPLDLYYEYRAVSNPMRSQGLIVCLKIGNAPSSSAIDRCVSKVPLMIRSGLPGNERQWTCRVYVKEALIALHNDRLLELPASVDSIERACLAAADAYLPYRTSAQQGSIHNNFSWIGTRTSHATPFEVIPDLFYPSEMDIDSTRRYPSSRSYGSLMDVDSSGGRTVLR